MNWFLLVDTKNNPSLLLIHRLRHHQPAMPKSIGMIPATCPTVDDDYDDNDLENGCPSASSSRSSSFYSRGDESDIITYDHDRQELAVTDVLISKKFIALQNDDVGSNKPPRRLSQCLQLVSRRPRSSFTLSTPMQSTCNGSANLPSYSTQNSLFHHQSSSSSPPLQHRLFIRVLVTMLIITLFGSMFLLYNQQRQISSLQSQLTIINQHRLFIEKKQSELVTQLRSSDASLEQCKYTQKQMASAHEVVGKTMGTLRREYTEARELLARCQAVEDRV